MRLRRPFWILLAVLLLAAGGFALHLRSQMHAGQPWREGSWTLPGLEAPVEVRFDPRGIPHVRAATGRDLARALGWLHANDRLEQMELTRRAVAGRLAEAVGEAGVALDRLMRTLRLRETAEAHWTVASEESREWLEAYAAGVNAWVRQREEDLPPLFQLLDLEWEPWTPADSLSVPVAMAANLSFAFGRPEENHLNLALQMGDEALADLLGRPGLAHDPEVLALARAAREAEPASDPLPRPEAGEAGGSNNWVLAGRRSESGAALVANDPHLGLRLPGVWYQAVLHCPDYEAAGFTLPGVPGVVIGQSPWLAWGFTNAMLDDHDLFAEELAPDGRSVRRGGEWVPLEIDETVIRVRGGEDRVLVRKVSDRGPVLEAEPEWGLPARSLRWTGHEPTDMLRSIAGLARARTLDEVLQTLDGFLCPAQNLVVGHRDGGILYTILGRAPRRGRGDGSLMLPAWEPETDWRGWLPREELLLVRDPSAGAVVTANHDTRPPGWNGAAMPCWYDTPYRARRIEESLAEREIWDVAGLASIQADTRDLYALELVELLERDAPALEGAAARALEVLQGWDGEMEPHGPSALIHFVEGCLQQAIFQDEEEAFGLLPPSDLFLRPRLLRALRGELEDSWWDDRRTGERTETRAEILQAALSRAWELVTAEDGEDPAAWNYGRVHQLVLAHPLGQVPVVGSWWNRGPWELPGSPTTVCAWGGSWRWEDLSRHVTWGPSMRFVADTADPDRSVWVLPAGNAGHPADPHYDDQGAAWREGRIFPLLWSEEALDRAGTRDLRLEPGPGPEPAAGR